MSEERIKGLRVKNDTGSAASYGDLIPFGSNGNLIDMLSGLDLEQELRLSGNHTVSITDFDLDDDIVITQLYKNKNNNQIIYTLITTIAKTFQNYLLWEGQEDFIQLKNNDPSILATEQGQIGEDQADIYIQLYQGEKTENSQPLHTKIINIDLTTGTQIIEQLDN